MDITKTGKLIVITGPGSVGKDAVALKLIERYPKLQKVITTTSRPPRPWEKPGIDYHFLAKEQFEELIKSNELLEYVNFSGNYYGTTRKALQPFLEGRAMIWKVEITRGAQIKELFDQHFPDISQQLLKKTAVIYLDVPDWDILRNRLKQRGASDEVADQRLNQDKKDWQVYKLSFQNIIMNMPNQLDDTVEQIIRLLV